MHLTMLHDLSFTIMILRKTQETWFSLPNGFIRVLHTVLYETMYRLEVFSSSSCQLLLRGISFIYMIPKIPPCS